jgi:hypothetical protein
LKIAAKVDAADNEYFKTEIRPLQDDPVIDSIGEIGDDEKEASLGGAAALLMPIDWPEPFVERPPFRADRWHSVRA